MGTVPNNFPPEQAMNIGGPILTGASLGNTGPLANTVFFTVPNRGMYQMQGLLHITQTDGAGTLGFTMTVPQLQVAAISGPVTFDIPTQARMALLEKGAQIACTVTATGVTATAYNVYVSAVRVF